MRVHPCSPRLECFNIKDKSSAKQTFQIFTLQHLRVQSKRNQPEMFASKESRADGKEKRTRRADFEGSGEESGAAEV